MQNTEQDQRDLSGAVYAFAQRWDSLGLRVLDAGAVAAAWGLAALAGFSQRTQAADLSNLLWFIGLPVCISLVVNQLAGLYGPVWRYASHDEAVRVVVAVGAATTLSTIVTSMLALRTHIDLSVLPAALVAALCSLVGIGGVRFQSRFFATERQRARDGDDPRTRVLIVGAGEAGAALAYELSHQQASDAEIVGFVDDDPRLAGRTIRGLSILGNTSQLKALCEAHRVDKVVVALCDADERKAALGRALSTSSQVKLLSPASERVAGHLVQGIRDLDVTDLLGRPHAPVDCGEIARYLTGATVLVTGAGGSIGSEMVRQIATFAPAQLIALDREETLLHEIELEVPEVIPVLADITDPDRLVRVFAQHRPDVVFHVAAQKHVPMLERFPLEAIRTNVIGTWQVAQAAADHGCTRLILISTDKAAEPYSVMGATKRVAEQIVFEVGRRYDRQFAAVRFGNVLGTRGSVVPTFLRQILDGGPVTVTSPEMTRFFMTVSESVGLVLQAGAMADPGSIFLLDMGEPVSILRLARQMIRLAGLRPDHDVPVSVVGLRPGERLHERLHDDAECVEPSDHPAISLLVPRAGKDWDGLAQDLDDLAASVARHDEHAALKLVREILVDRGIPCHLDVRGSSEDRPRSALVLRDEVDGVTVELDIDRVVRGDAAS